VFDGGLRHAQTDAARAAYDATVATYRQTVLTSFQGVEDNLAALRILEEENGVQDEAVKAAQKSVDLTTDQYKAGTVSYLNVVTAQTISLADEVTAIQIRGRRMAAAVLLVQALGGGWQATYLPSAEDVTKRGHQSSDHCPDGALADSCEKAPGPGSPPPAAPPKK
jgi:outer membrane protein TolC